MTMRVSAKFVKLAGALALAVAVAACGEGGAKKAEEHIKQGQTLAAEGKHEAALAEFKKAAELNKDSVDAHVHLGHAYAALKKYDEALAAYAAGKKADRASPKPYLGNARVHMAMGDVKGAIADLDQATEVDPGNTEGMLLQGQASMMPQKQPDGSTGVSKVSLERAQLNLETFVQKMPDNVEGHYWLAKLYEQIGQKEKAVASWNKAKDLAAGKPAAAKMAGEAAEALNRLR